MLTPLLPSKKFFLVCKLIYLYNEVKGRGYKGYLNRNRNYSYRGALVSALCASHRRILE